MADFEEHITFEEFTARLRINPTEAIKALATELVAQLGKEYLTIEEVAERLSLDRKTVKNKMAAGSSGRAFTTSVHPGLVHGLSGARFKPG